MKGIAHFITGVAVATFFPAVVRSGALGSLLPVLGGVGGLLPDTLDFKFARYWERFDLEIDPGIDPDPEAMVEALVDAMRKAYETGVSQNVVLHTVRLGADLWREYVVRFVPEAGEIAVAVGPLVNTGQAPFAGTWPPGGREARRQAGVPLVHTYSEAYRINVFNGPSFRFTRIGDELVIDFLDWHHRWTHSLVLALWMGLLSGALVAGLSGWRTGLWAGIVSGLGYAAHILEDQLGHMGSNLFWPFTRRRIPGLGWIHAGDPLPNFLTVWTAVILILFNLDRFSDRPWLPAAPYLLLTLGVPWAILLGVHILEKRKPAAVSRTEESLKQAERIAEAEPLELS
ncbi:MAG: metal-dependent hydrolase [Anaerolineae bacterium]|nr:metal-dependent hydrolase [Anaerolineae bacterium]